MAAYLQGRSQYVQVSGYVSDSIEVPSGVGQGTHLGPLLFTLYINDVKYAIKNSNFLLFADDCKIFRCVDSSDDQAALQSDLNSFNNWCKLNALSVNTGKCCQVKYTRKLSPLQSSYYIDHIHLKSAQSVVDLGVYLDCKLSFNLHLDSIIARSNKLLGFVIRNSRSFSSVRCISILYVSIVRPVMEYCCTIWSPSYVTHIKRLEKVQRKFIKFLCFKSGIDFDMFPYENHLKYFSLPHLLTRRMFFDILFAFKVVNNIIDCPNIFQLFSFNIPTRDLRRHAIFNVEYHRTNYGKHSSLTRICNTVNSMDVDMTVSNLSNFKTNLRALLF